MLATTVGQAVGWAAGSGIAYYVLALLGRPRGHLMAKIAMSVVYVGLGGLPLLAYHGLFGGPLLGLPQVDLEPWHFETHPDAHWLLFRFHPAVDLSVIPLGLVFLGLLWATGSAPFRHRLVQSLLALSLLATSLAVALSLAIHSTLVHIKLPP